MGFETELVVDIPALYLHDESVLYKSMLLVKTVCIWSFPVYYHLRDYNTQIMKKMDIHMDIVNWEYIVVQTNNALSFDSWKADILKKRY